MSLPVNSSANVLSSTNKQSNVQLELPPSDNADAAQFAAALAQHAKPNAVLNSAIHSNSRVSLGDKIMGRAGELAGDLKADQAHVSQMLDQATRVGDSASLMKAILALSDYQMRVQFVSKTVSKATSSLDQLTRLQ